MITSQELKDIVISLGADKCGISHVDRFIDAPTGFKPNDIWSKARSVVVFLKRMPLKAIEAENYAVYSHTAVTLYSVIDRIGLELCSRLQDVKVNAVPVPTDTPYLFWDEKEKRGMGILSLRHAAKNAGLGILGRNTLLINPELGNMVYIGAVLVDEFFEQDKLESNTSCPEGCSLCIDTCPVDALNGISVDQKLCRSQSCFTHPRGWDVYVCNECRKVCPLSGL